MKKVFVTALIFFVITISNIYAQDTTPEVFTSGEWEYQANDTGWTISAYKGTSSNIEIPYQFEGKYITQLAENLFINNNSLERVSIPSAVSVIGKNAFQGCSSLKEVTMPFQIKTVAEGTFQYCTSLENIILPSTLTSIGKNAFADCSKLKEIVIPSNVSSIGESAFENCRSLSSIYVSGKLSTVNANAFTNTAWMNSQTDEFVFIGKGILLKYNGNSSNVEIPYGTAAVANAFEGNTTVESVLIPETVLRIMQNAFKDAVNLSNVNIPEYTKTIGAGAFWNCKSLPSIEISNSVTSIGTDAFRGCERLTELIIPAKVTSITARVAADCPSLRTVRLPEGVTKFNKNAIIRSANAVMQIEPGSPVEDLLQKYEIPYVYNLRNYDDFIYRSDGSEVSVIKYFGNLYDVEIPSEINGLPVTLVDAAAFQNNQSVHRVSIPDSVRTIGEWAFSYMDSLDSVQLPLGLESIGSNAFTGSANLKDLNIPKDLSKIGKDAFDHDANIIICAAEGTTAGKQLKEMGYTVNDINMCRADTALLDRWGEANLNIDSSCDCVPGKDIPTEKISNNSYTSIDKNGDYAIITVPDGSTDVSGDLVPDTNKNIILVVPASVINIDKNILDNRTVIIVSDSGTYAESFALTNNISFVIRINTWMYH